MMSIQLDGEAVGALGPLCAEALLNRLRAGAEIPAAAILVLSQLPWIDYLRGEVKAEDGGWLGEWVRSPRAREERNLAIALLCGLTRSDALHTSLTSLWEDHTHDYDLRWQLAPRLLDEPALPEPIHREIYAWVAGNWDRWRADATAWYGGPDTVLERVEARLRDGRFPPSKAWLYLCIAGGSTDQEAARRLWESHRGHAVAFVAEVAGELSTHARPAAAVMRHA